MRRIIDGILYDTSKSDFVCGFNGNFSPSKQRSSYCCNYYIAKNGVIFETYKNEIQLSDEKHVDEIKRRMKPSTYKKYFELVIPGKKVKVEPEQSFTRLEKVS